ncbi:tetratricopeptide repeat protein [Rhodomicrobium sp. Az07]|uniref:DUF2659 family protein n=1 Tax=Rhodomicrobium sp. Az07 TaxID=2839034 RepID=UPI001BEC40F0|nr:tetratricopeptide repeat protein [Rhodomicrobium sp. Az07]MBT3070556.1 tetratricopeptide repeat protein [Rhodomicrobium sp. Az07]
MSSDESFIREVNEEHRRQQAALFFKKYGIYLGVAALVIAAGIGGYKWDQARRAADAARGGDALVTAITLHEDGKAAEAEKALADLAGSGPGNYRVLARLHAAAESLAQKKYEQAAEDYRGVASDDNAPATLRDFARVQIAALSVDKESYESLSQTLAPYRSGTSEWRFAAKDVLGIAAFKEGKREEAERIFGEIASDGAAPAGMRQRAQIMLALLFDQPKAAQAGQTGTKDGANEAKTQ